MEIPNIYSRNYKKLAIVPILLIITSLFFIPQIQLGIDFKGGTVITLYTDAKVDTAALEQELTNADIRVHSIRQVQTTLGNVVEVEIESDEKLTRAEELRSEFTSSIENVSRLEAYLIQTNETDETNQTIITMYNEARTEVNSIADEIFQTAGYTNKKAAEIESSNELRDIVTEQYLVIKSSYEEKIDSILRTHAVYSSISVDVVSPSLSSRFIEKAAMVTAVAILFAIILAFIVFRDPMPSLLVLTGAVADIIICLGAMGLFQIPLTLPSFAALLMMLGFSLDTDMLLTMRILKVAEGEPREKAYGAMKTGATMSLTDFIAFVALFVLAVATSISTYYEISSIAICGLIGDVIATWMFNAVILLWYLERKRKRFGS